MVLWIVIEEFQMSIRVPHTLSDAESAALRRTLSAGAFRARLLRLIRRIFRREPALRKARIRLSR
jgi:hypothetical protein